MLRPKLDPLPGPVADLQDRILHWRRTRPHRDLMPDDVWLKAAQFARQHGISAQIQSLNARVEVERAIPAIVNVCLLRVDRTNLRAKSAQLGALAGAPAVETGVPDPQSSRRPIPRGRGPSLGSSLLTGKRRTATEAAEADFLPTLDPGNGLRHGLARNPEPPSDRRVVESQLM